ncbi:MAG: alpha/beta fold hydrolase, partial [Phycicoccus sp.]
ITGASMDADTAGLPTDFFAAAADAAAGLLPDARRTTIEVPGHVADPTLLGPVLTAFFTA